MTMGKVCLLPDGRKACATIGTPPFVTQAFLMMTNFYI